MLTLAHESFEVPERLEAKDFVARKLCASDAELDFKAVISSIDIIKKTRGGNWPNEDLTLEENKIDLSWHQREFENKSSFAYTVMNKDETECLGCFYLYKPGFRYDVPEGTDVDISFWVTKKAYDDGLCSKLYNELKQWIDSKWHFNKPFWSNTELPTTGSSSRKMYL